MTYQPAAAAKPPMNQSMLVKMDWLVAAILFSLALVVMSASYPLVKAWAYFLGTTPHARAGRR